MAKITIPCRLAFPALFEPTSVGDSPDKAWSARGIIDPRDTKTVKLIEDTIRDVARANPKWNTKPGLADQILAKLQKDGKVCFSREEYVNKNGEPYDGFEGMFHIGARTAEAKGTPPTVVDRDRTRLTAKDGKPYAGCYVNLVVDIWAQDNQYGRRINASLAGVQFVRDGDAFGGSRPASIDDFEELEDLGDETEEFEAADDLG